MFLALKVLRLSHLEVLNALVCSIYFMYTENVASKSDSHLIKIYHIIVYR
jgi:hypothetical protein